MGTNKFAGNGSQDVSSNPPDVEIPMSAGRGGSEPITMAGSGNKDTKGTNDGAIKPSKGINDPSNSGPGTVKFAGDV